MLEHTIYKSEQANMISAKTFIPSSLKIFIIRRLIDGEQSDETSVFGWKKYYNVDAIYEWLDGLLEKYPNILTGYEYGKLWSSKKESVGYKSD